MVNQKLGFITIAVWFGCITTVTGLLTINRFSPEKCHTVHQ